MNKILIICGPTASSKSALAVKCAKLLNTEVISADSMNVYKGLDVGTAKPTMEERLGIVHHLIDVVEPTKTFSVGDYKDLALPIVYNLLENKKIPIVCGGTGFYINSLLYDLSYGNSTSNLPVRDKYFKLAEEKGNDFVYNILIQKDPETAQKLHKNDLKRVVRALEIFESGIKKSDIKDDLTPRFDYDAYSIDYPTDILYDRINKRVDIMFENGLVDEVKRLINSGISKDDQCMQGIGYKEIIPYLNGETSLEEALNLIKLNTRHYAKRQKTFFRKLPNLNYLQPNDLDLLAKRIIDKL